VLAGGLIYWATVGSATVKMSSLDGSGRTTLLNETTTAFYTGLTLYRDALYVADDQRRSAAARIALQVTWSVRIFMGGSVAEWLACWTQAQKGPGSNRMQSRRCRATVLGKLFTPIVPLFTKQRNW